MSEVAGGADGDFGSSEAAAVPATATAASAAVTSIVPQMAANLAETPAGRPPPSVTSVVSGVMEAAAIVNTTADRTRFFHAVLCPGTGRGVRVV